MKSTINDTKDSQQISPPSEQLSHPKYRSDIDGLRAVAVLSVVGFHAFPLWVKGGFIGVDIFFVISGYLISTIIFGNLDRGTFSFLEFYSRRIKRIFPALLVVLFTCFAFGWYALLADEYVQLGKHIAAGAGFVSNLVLWSESGYFDNAADTKPLLHLWSLGIEEQFYIVWPLILWASYRRHLNLVVTTAVIFSISFATNVFLVNTNQVVAFYSPLTRFWELFVGAAIAYAGTRNVVPNLTLANTFSIVGSALVLTGLMFVSEDSAFPGWWAILPTIGAALIIAGASGKKRPWINILLSNKVFVWFGLISYPLYLWHWPLLAFAHILEGQEPSRLIRVSAVLASIILAWLTYIFVEKPIRFGHGIGGRGRRNVVYALAVLMTIVACLGIATFWFDGFLNRTASNPKLLNSGQLTHEETQAYMEKNFYLCNPEHIRIKAIFGKSPIQCYQSKQGRPIDIALIGDSHSQHLFIGLAEALKDKNVVFYMKDAPPSIRNAEFNDIFGYVINNGDIKTVILSSYWAIRFKLTSVDELQATALALVNANKHVYISDDIPDFAFNARKCAVPRFGGEPQCVESSERFLSLYSSYNSGLEQVANSNPSIKLLRTMKYLCDDKTCWMAVKGKLYYRDTNHLNINGSKFIGLNIIRDNPDLEK